MSPAVGWRAPARRARAKWGIAAAGTLPAGIVAALLSGASPALAATETIGFDNLAPGSLVTNQYSAQGLELGKAAALGFPVGAIGTGDCGAPTASEDPALTTARSPKIFAVLAKCAGETEAGLYGKLLTAPTGAISVYVRAAAGKPNVRLALYSSEGVELENTSLAADSGEWQQLLLPDTKANAIGYFSISAATPNKEAVAIDDLAFTGSATTTTTTTATTSRTTTSAAAIPPRAQIGLATSSPAAGRRLTFSGAGSSAGSGHIISYGWNFSGGSSVETSTGTNPIAHAMFGPGSHTVALTVTNSNGEHASSRFTVSVAISRAHPPDGGEGECSAQLEVSDATLLGECIQKLPGGGYVISGNEVQVNGMSIVLHGGGPLKVVTVRDIALAGSVTELTGGSVYFELQNTPIGDMVIGGRDLNAEPMVLEARSATMSTFPILHGARRGMAHAAGSGGGSGGGGEPVKIGSGVKPSKVLLMAIGIGQHCSAGSKHANCCPPSGGTTACAELPGGFPLAGQVDVFLNNRGQALFDVQVGLSLSDVHFEATGSLEIIADLERGIQLGSLEFTIPEASLAPIFKVTNAKFAYYFPEYWDESKRDSWEAKASLTFGEEVVQMEGELAFKHGEFSSAAMKFKTSHGGVPIYPGIFLNEIGASVGVHPLAFGGSLGASIAELLELEFAFKFREATSEELGFFGGKGSLTFHEEEIASIAADVYTDGYVDAQVKLEIHFPISSSEPLIIVRGGVGFWDEPNSGLWQASGNVYFKLWIISAEIAGLVNNQYAAGCVHVGAEGIFGGGVQGRYRFSDGNISGGLFGNDNCNDQLQQYVERPLREHKGGFVGEEGAHFLQPGSFPGGFKFDAPAGSSAAAAGAGAEAFNLPEGTPGQELRISSASGTPVVTLYGPGGVKYTTPTGAGHLVLTDGRFMSAIAPDPHQVLVFLRTPKGGEWALKPAAGSAPISSVESAQDVPPAVVKAHVHHAHGKRWLLSYRIANFVPGSKVRFVERGKDSGHLLGVVSNAHGTLRFMPQEALGLSRKITAELLDAEGAVVRQIAVGSYRAPAAFRPGKAHRLRIARHGTSALIAWSAVHGARGYRIKVTGSNGRLLTLVRKPGARSVLVANVLPFESLDATVVAFGGKNRLLGTAAHGRLRAFKVKSRHRHRRR